MDRRTAYHESAAEDFTKKMTGFHSKSGLILSYLRHGCGEDDNFVQLTNALHELIHARPFDDIDIMKLAFDLDRNREIGLV